MSWLTEDQKKDLEAQHMQQFHNAFAEILKISNLYRFPSEYFEDKLEGEE